MTNSNQVRESTFVASPHVRHANVEGLQILLDLTNASYFVLDEVASAMWAAVLVNCTPDEVVSTVVSQFDVDADVLRADAGRFVQNCVDRGFLQIRALPSSRKACAPATPDKAPHRSIFQIRSPGLLVLRAAHMLFSTSRALKHNGFTRVYAAANNRHVGSDRIEPAKALRAFALAENLYLARRAPNDCLPRSLALFGFLRGCGQPVCHVIGVGRIPFRAHAWVELDSLPLLEQHGATNGLTEIARLSYAR